MGDDKTKSENSENTIIDDLKIMKNNEKSEQNLPRFGKRHIQAICLFLSLSVALTVRAHLSVTIVAMTDVKRINFSNHTPSPDISNKNGNTHVITSNKSEIGDDVMDTNNLKTIEENLNLNHSKIMKLTPFITDKESNKTRNSITENISRDTSLDDNLGWSVYRTYEWSKSSQEMVTSSFFISYTIMQLPMGVISQYYGGKLPVLVALLANAILSIVTPWMAIIGWWAVCSCRFLQGMTQAAMYPGIQAMLGKWAPLSERGRLTTRIFTGGQFGTIVAFQLAGFLAGSPLGWPSAFWASGLLSFICFVLLLVFGAATPAEHPTITDAEKEYIMGHNDEFVHVPQRRTPWKEILTSVPVWAMVTTNAGSTFAYLFLLIEMPLYMSKILHVNIRDNGLLSSLPYIAMWITSICLGQVSDFIINRNYLRVINVRRICNSIGMVVCAFMMVAFSYAESVPSAVILLIISIASHAGVQTGFLINQIDLSPHFAGTLMAIANLVGNFVTLAAPLLVSYIVTDVENQSQWRIMFWITAVVLLVTNAVFVVFIKVDIQPWNDSQNYEDSSQEFEYEKMVKVPDEKGKVGKFCDEEETTV